MIDFGGVTYYIDIQAFDDVVALKGGADKVVSVHERKTYNDDNKLIGSKFPSAHEAACALSFGHHRIPHHTFY